MSAKAMAEAWEFAVTPGAKLVALSLAEGATGDDDVYVADVPWIMERTGLREGEVFEALHELAESGHLERRDLLTFRFVYAA